ncbi:hypothetical protein IAU59_003899 [Kwoniella sp. CBS 9459]
MMASGFIPPQTWCQTWCLNSWVDAETVGRQDSRFRVSRFNLRRAQSLSQATVEKVEREVEELLEEHRKMVDEVSPESFKSARRSGHDRLHYGAVTGGDLPSLCPPLSQYMRSSNNTVQTALGQPLHHMLPGSQLGYPPQGNTHYRFTHPAVTPDQAFGGVSNDDVTYISNATLKRLDSFHECGHLDCNETLETQNPVVIGRQTDQVVSAPIHVQSGIPGVSLSAPSNPSMQASSRYSTDSVPH